MSRYLLSLRSDLGAKLPKILSLLVMLVLLLAAAATAQTTTTEAVVPSDSKWTMMNWFISVLFAPMTFYLTEAFPGNHKWKPLVPLAMSFIAAVAGQLVFEFDPMQTMTACSASLAAANIHGVSKYTFGRAPAAAVVVSDTPMREPVPPKPPA